MALIQTNQTKRDISTYMVRIVSNQTKCPKLVIPAEPTWAGTLGIARTEPGKLDKTDKEHQMDKPYQNEHNRADAIEAVIRDKSDKQVEMWKRGILSTIELIWHLQETQAETIALFNHDKPAI